MTAEWEARKAEATPAAAAVAHASRMTGGMKGVIGAGPGGVIGSRG
jgi:hypothetical protein